MIKSNIAEFNAKVDAFTAKNPTRVTELQKKIVLEALRGVVFRTPVDTGRARGGWQASIGSPATSVVENFDATGNETIQKALSVLESLEPYQIVFISNNVSYIIFLEEGTSDQAPNGMVAVTVEELKAMFK